MRTWIELALLPVSVVVGFALLARDSPVGGLIALAWAFIIVPHGAQFLIRGSAGGTDPYHDAVTHYWRSDGR